MASWVVNWRFLQAQLASLNGPAEVKDKRQTCGSRITCWSQKVIQNKNYLFTLAENKPGFEPDGEQQALSHSALP